MLRATIDCEMEVMFISELSKAELSMQDAVFQFSEQKFVNLIVTNSGDQLVRLKKREALGEVQPVVEVDHNSEADNQPEEQPEIVSMITAEERKEWEEKLLAQLDWEVGHLPEEQQQALRDLLVSYGDAFALDATELGTTMSWNTISTLETVHQYVSLFGGPPLH